jgi:hypothetical protein
LFKFNKSGFSVHIRIIYIYIYHYFNIINYTIFYFPGYIPARDHGIANILSRFPGIAQTPGNAHASLVTIVFTDFLQYGTTYMYEYSSIRILTI